MTYEVKIWAAAHDAPGQLVYAREGLPEPSHNVQESLPPSMTLFWSVRARFLLNGLPRVIEAKKTKKQSGGRSRELDINSGDLGEVSGFPLRTCGPAHHLCV